MPHGIYSDEAGLVLPCAIYLGDFMDRLPTMNSRDLAVRLLAPQARWGWEYVVPEPAAPSPLREVAPRWVGLTEPEALRRYRSRVRHSPKVLGAGALVAMWLSAYTANLGLVFWPAAGASVAVPVAAWCALAGIRYSSARGKYESYVSAEWSRFQAAAEDWQARVIEHDRHEHARIASAVLWYPVQPTQRWSQVNVFGGTADGWASLLATLGLSLLSAGSRLLVMDFTERGVARDLAALADTVGYAVRTDLVPGECIVGVDGLSAAEAGELVADALDGFRGQHPDTERAHAFDSEAIEAVCAQLGSRYSFERIAAGLAVARRTFDTDCPSPVTAAEIRQLNRVNEILGSLLSDNDELRFLTAAMRLVAGRSARAPIVEPIWPQAGLRVIATSDANARRTRLLNRLVFFRVLHEIRSGIVDANAGAVLVAGADQLSASELEALAHDADRAGLRLVVICEHLRGDHARLLGAHGSAALLMRLGPTEEAVAAADFVGRGHRFVLSQLSEQIGRSFTDGVSDTAGDSVTSTITETYSPTSTGSSDSRSRAATWSRTRSLSWGHNTSGTHTWARAYEYAVEPTTFQSLPVTAFMWVENSGKDRRVVAGDCNPGIALLDRVAAHPRPRSAALSC